VDDAEGRGLVVTFPQAGQQARVQGGLPSRPGVLDSLVRLAQDGDHVGGPGLQAAGAEFRDGPAAADDGLVMPISTGNPD
jgi:hypothetical protein